MLLAQPDNPVRPASWWGERQLVARRLLAAGNADLAYKLVQQHGLIDGNAYSEAEFLSGYIALRYLKEPALAFDHFARILARVDQPLRQGARRLLGRPRRRGAAASPIWRAKWYAAGAEHMATFYGQLAAHQLGNDAPPHPVPEPRPSAAEQAHFDAQRAGPRRAAVLCRSATASTRDASS